MSKIDQIAAAHDAAILTDRDGDIAIQARHYDDDGRKQVRYRPDPGDFLPPTRWESMTAEESARHVC